MIGIPQLAGNTRQVSTYPGYGGGLSSLNNLRGKCQRITGFNLQSGIPDCVFVFRFVEAMAACTWTDAVYTRSKALTVPAKKHTVYMSEGSINKIASLNPKTSRVSCSLFSFWGQIEFLLFAFYFIFWPTHAMFFIDFSDIKFGPPWVSLFTIWSIELVISKPWILSPSGVKQRTYQKGRD